MEVESKTQQIRCNFAVRLGHYILVIGGHCLKDRESSCHEIWMFNLYTEQWAKCIMQECESVPRIVTGACVVAIRGDVYMFGGVRNTDFMTDNQLWKLTRTDQDHFAWHEVSTSDKPKVPSPRADHSGWEYNRMLWIFGGYGFSPVGYLNDYGEDDYGYNNQLLCFVPSTEEWRNLKCSGSCPTPRGYCASAIIRDTVWLYGGNGRLSGPYSRSRFKVRPGLNPRFKPGLALNRIPEAGLS